MLCARVMRGISSIESIVAPVAAASRIACGDAERIGETDHRLSRRAGRWPEEARTCRMTSDVASVSARVSDGRALRRVGMRLVKPGGDAGRRSDGDLQPGFDQRRRTGRHDRDARFARSGLFRDADFHLGSKSNRSPLTACDVLRQPRHDRGGDLRADRFSASAADIPAPHRSWPGRGDG